MLKSGAESPPIYLAPGIGDSFEGLRPLANHIRVENSIYALRPSGSDGLAEPQASIEDMAELHFEELRRLQPHGPYYLIGYSLGGLVMLEIAERFRGGGEKIALLAMLDTYPHRQRLRLAPRIRLTGRLGLQRLASRLRIGPAFGRTRESPDGTHDPVLRRLKEAQYRALLDYRPRFYDGDVKYVRAAIPTYFPSDPIPVWSHLVRSLTVTTVPGRHLQMMTTQVEAVGAAVTRYLEEARSLSPQR